MEDTVQVGHHTGLLANPEVWVTISFILFVVLFGGKLWTTLTGMLDRRAESVRAELDEAERLKQEAQAMLTEATRRREAALAEAKQLLESAHIEAARLAASMRQDAEQAAQRRERMALDRISSAEKAALAEVRAAAAAIAARAAEQMIKETLSTDTDGTIIDQAIAGLPAAFNRRQAA